MLTLPIHVSAPLHKLQESQNYFRRLHLISDVLLGAFRLYGHFIIKIAEFENIINDSLDQSIETLKKKDSHGLWSTTIFKLMQDLDKKKSQFLSPELASAFGVGINSIKQPAIKKMAINNIVIDSKGQKQSIEINNTPVELLINFRNRYVGHGTVYSEAESKQIYQVYEPILNTFIDQLSKCSGILFSNVSDNLNIHGIDNSSDGFISLREKGEI
jgi:hypothetical protein